MTDRKIILRANVNSDWSHRKRPQLMSEFRIVLSCPFPRFLPLFSALSLSLTFPLVRARKLTCVCGDRCARPVQGQLFFPF